MAVLSPTRAAPLLAPLSPYGTGLGSRVGSLSPEISSTPIPQAPRDANAASRRAPAPSPSSGLREDLVFMGQQPGT